MIEKNTTIPTQKSQVFSTAEDNQPADRAIELKRHSLKGAMGQCIEHAGWADASDGLEMKRHPHKSVLRRHRSPHRQQGVRHGQEPALCQDQEEGRVPNFGEKTLRRQSSWLPFAIAPQNPTIGTATAASRQQRPLQRSEERLNTNELVGDANSRGSSPVAPAATATANRATPSFLLPSEAGCADADGYCDADCGANVTSSGVSMVMDGSPLCSFEDQWRVVLLLDSREVRG